MKKTHLFQTLVVLVACSAGFQRHADADIFSQCGQRMGTTRLFDSESNSCQYVEFDNLYWGDFGWNDRADQMANDGNYQNNCLYEDWRYGGQSLLLPRGYYTNWHNTVSSNLWTSGNSCR